MCKVNLNPDLNGIELVFSNKPDAATLAAVKANGFRWSPKNKLWYAKQTAERLTFAQSLGEIKEAEPTAAAAEIINLDNLGVKPDNFSYYGAELAKLIRNDFKSRGVKGVTVRSDRSGYTTSITVTLKATAEDLASLEEAAERYNKSHFVCDIDSNNGVYTGGRYLYYNEYNTMTEEQKEAAYYNYLSEQIKHISGVNHHNLIDNRAFYWELTTAFYNKVVAVFKIANQWNYDNSDSMTDYFDVGYYIDIDIKKPENFEPRATMTAEERTTYEAEKAQKAAEEAEAMRKYQEEQEERKKAAEQYNKWLEESEEIILNDISITDLEEPEQIYITGLIGGIGKECNLEEVKEEAAENPHHEDALITRIITFKTEDALNRFNKMYMHDFVFIAGKGGTATEDSRINSTQEFFKLNQEQRETVKFYACNSIAVYYNDSLKIVINPEGYSYSRYVYIPTENTEILTAPGKLEELQAETANKEPFYFPESVEVQANNLKIGEQITIYQCDGWILNSIYAGFGTITNIEPGNYAQYTGIYITLSYGKKSKQVFIRDQKECLIYKGIKNLLPEDVTRRKINDHLSELYNYDVLIPNIYNYYRSQGEEPILNTWQH